MRAPSHEPPHFLSPTSPHLVFPRLPRLFLFSRTQGIQLNGDLSYDIAEFLLETYPDQVNKTVLYTIAKGNIKKKFF